MKNKFLLAGLIFLFSLSLSAQTYNGSCGDNLTWTLHIGTGILTISGYGYMQEFFYTPTGTYSTPWFSYRESIKTVIIKEGVTSIGNYAFVDCSKLTSVTIPSSVTSIRYGAFSNCDGLKEVHIADITKWCTLSFGSYHANPLYYANNLYVNGSLVTDLIIPNSVTSIGAFAFYGCSSLTSVTIPNGVTSIGQYTFYGCSSLTSVIIPNSVTTIGEHAFSGCSSLTSVTIPNSVTSIGSFAFSSCTGLTSVTIPNSVTSIGSYAFFYCSSLTSVTIPNSVTSIGNSAFSDCSKLTSVTIPNSVTSIGEKAFYNVLNIVYNGTATGTPWGALSINGYVDGFLAYSDASKTTLLACFRAAEGELVIPNSVISIGESAFRGCSSLTSVIIPNSVTSIGESAFRGCSSLTSVIIPNSVTSIGESVFYDCSSMTSVTIPNGITSIGKYTFYKCSSLTSVTIPNGVTSIENGAFSGCSSLTSVTIPNGVTSIENGAFSGCSSLTSVTIYSNTIVSKNYNYNYNSLRNIFGSQVTEYIIGDGVISIGNSAFSYCSSLTSVIIPSSVTSIGGSAFRGCSSLTSVIIPNSVTSIGESAFNCCNSLTTVTISNSVSSIGNDAFYTCLRLTAVHISDMAAWCKISFGNLDANPLYYANNLYLNGELVTDLIIPNSVTSIGSSAFSNCSNLTSIAIPNSVTSIEKNAFSYCRKLTSITIGNSVRSIGEWAFSGCSSLTSVTINSNKIVSKYYSYNSSLISIFGSQVTEYIIGDGVTSIGGYAFQGCSCLTSVTIPNSVTSIGEHAFYNCSKLTSITIPNSVTSIEKYAFSYCSSLTSVIIPSSVTSIGESAFRGCSSLTSVIIPSSVTSIEENAFYGCKIETIYSFMTGTLCEIKNTTFGLKNTASETILYVPKNAMSVYSKADIWKEFNIVPMTAEQVETNEEVVKVEPTETTADIVWPTITGASTYEMVIRDTDGNDICTLIFNAQGELTQIAYNAPDRNRVPEQTAGQVAGFAFTIIGLDSGTTYDYTIYAKDSDGKVIDTKTGSFTTDGIGVATYLEHSNTNADNKQSVKVIRNGNVYILNGGKTYNLQGMEIK